MTEWRSWLCLLMVGLGLSPLIAEAGRQSLPEVVLIYKDGFSIKGRVHEKTNVIYDSASGRAFPIFTGNFFIDDNVRNIIFSRDQIQSVTKIKPPPPRTVVRFDRYIQTLSINPRWEFEGFSEWNDKGERTATFNIPRPLEMLQRISFLTPRHIFAITNDYQWDLWYFTQEFGPTLTRDIVHRAFKDNKKLKLKEGEKLLEIAAFLQEAGWYEEAEKDLQLCVNNFPDQKKLAQEKLDQLKEIRAGIFVEGIEKASSVGQHKEAQEQLRIYDKEGYAKLVSPSSRDLARDLKRKYETAKSDIEKAKGYLNSLPLLAKNQKAWEKATEFIADELTPDTVEKLDIFIQTAQQPGKVSTEEVLAMAVSGWLQGKNAADQDVKLALKLARARQLTLDYLQTDDAKIRANLLSTLKQEIDLPADVMARLVRMIPPSHALEAKKISTKVMTMTIEAPENGGGSYLVQLPPDYHPMRSYPVLLVLSGGLEKTEDTLKRFTEEAAKQGFILAAPLWVKGKANRAKYQYSVTEHKIVLDTLRDLRRRFQIDSDRVFLFGWEEGANMAFDVGLGHPDLFAGVVPMSPFVMTFTRRYYWPNAQYLPFYIIEGERNFTNTKMLRDLFKDWTREPYMITYVEYKGRGTEWYSAEVPMMFNWMSRKKRHHPTKELGRHNPKGGLGEEFRSSREFDNRFYWLSTEGIIERNENQHNAVVTLGYYQPATIQAYMSSGNRSNSQKKAEVWHQLDLRITGMRQATVLLTTNMMDFEKPLLIRVNGHDANGGKKLIQPSFETMLDELAFTGDRQRLVVAKISVAVR